MSCRSMECSSLSLRPEPLTVFSGPMPGWQLEAVAVMFSIG